MTITDAILQACPKGSIATVRISGQSVDVVVSPTASDHDRAAAAAAANAIVSGWDWSPAAESDRQAKRVAADAAALASAASPVPRAVRALATAIVRRVNVRLAAIGQPIVTEAEVLAEFEMILRS